MQSALLDLYQSVANLWASRLRLYQWHTDHRRSHVLHDANGRRRPVDRHDLHLRTAARHRRTVQWVSLFNLIIQILIINPHSHRSTTLLHSTTEDLGLEISRILNGFFTSGYDKRVRPNYGGKPVEGKNRFEKSCWAFGLIRFSPFWPTLFVAYSWCHDVCDQHQFGFGSADGLHQWLLLSTVLARSATCLSENQRNHADFRWCRSQRKDLGNIFNLKTERTSPKLISSFVYLSCPTLSLPT